LENLQNARNNVEHKYSTLSHLQVQELIAKSFPLLVKLLEICEGTPGTALGNTYSKMVQEAEFYDSEKKKCRNSFTLVKFPFDELNDESFECGACGSALILQTDDLNTDHDNMQLECRSCGEAANAETAIVLALERKYGAHDHVAFMDGGDAILHDCPECGADAYVLAKGCVWCENILGQCKLCQDQLVPSDISGDDSALCGYCGHKLSKND
jgi:DNA-directed RNA polymerase subunit M/transcription elongation factor TFIIS